MSDWEETPNPLKGLYISSGLGTPRDLPGGTRECCWGEGSLGGPCLANCHCDPAPNKRKRMDGWMDDYNC